MTKILSSGGGFFVQKSLREVEMNSTFEYAYAKKSPVADWGLGFDVDGMKKRCGSCPSFPIPLNRQIT
jgi:hypothetical protein